MAAWQFAKAQATAARQGWTPFISMQNRYNLLYREEEREMIPLCSDLGRRGHPLQPTGPRAARRHRARDGAPERPRSDQIRSAPTAYEPGDAEVIASVERLARERRHIAREDRPRLAPPPTRCHRPDHRRHPPLPHRRRGRRLHPPPHPANALTAALDRIAGTASPTPTTPHQQSERERPLAAKATGLSFQNRSRDKKPHVRPAAPPALPILERRPRRRTHAARGV